MIRKRMRGLPETAGPKHSRLTDAIMTDAIAILSPGEPLPSERELMEYYGVSRATVRRSLDDMVNRGIIVRIQGKGTFVATERDDASRLISFSEHARRMGHRPSSRVVQMSCSIPPPDIAKTLNTIDGLPQWRLERIRFANGLAMAHETCWYPVKRFPGFDTLNHADSIYGQLASRYQIVPDYAEQSVWSEVADRTLAEHLEVVVGTALLVIERNAYAQGTIVETNLGYYRGDRYKLTLHTPHITAVSMRGTTKGKNE